MAVSVPVPHCAPAAAGGGVQHPMSWLFLRTWPTDPHFLAARPPAANTPAGRVVTVAGVADTLQLRDLLQIGAPFANVSQLNGADVNEAGT